MTNCLARTSKRISERPATSRQNAPRQSTVSGLEARTRVVRLAPLVGGGFLKDHRKGEGLSGKPASGGQKRNCPKLIRFAPDELRLVSERARASGRPVACYIRESALGASPRSRRTDFSDSLIRALARAATSLTSLAATAKEHRIANAAELERAVSEVLELIRALD